MVASSGFSGPRQFLIDFWCRVRVPPNPPDPGLGLGVKGGRYLLIARSIYFCPVCWSRGAWLQIVLTVKKIDMPLPAGPEPSSLDIWPDICIKVRHNEGSYHAQDTS